MVKIKLKKSMIRQIIKLLMLKINQLILLLNKILTTGKMAVAFARKQDIDKSTGFRLSLFSIQFPLIKFSSYIANTELVLKVINKGIKTILGLLQNSLLGMVQQTIESYLLNNNINNTLGEGN